MPWSVQITSYEDDYKHRYDNGVYPEVIKLFKTKKAAYAYVTSRMEKEVISSISDWDAKEIAEKDLIKYFDDVDDHWQLKAKFKGKYSNLCDIVHEVMQGQYVDMKMTFDVREVLYTDPKSLN